MNVDVHDPEEYTPEPDPATDQQEYEPSPVEVGAVVEADPADVADQAVEVPMDEPGHAGDDDYDDEVG